MKTRKIRRLNDEGLSRMKAFLESFDLPPDATQRPPQAEEILFGTETSEHTPNHVDVELDRTFATRFDLAKYMHESIPRLGLQDPAQDAGLWAWLALLWFDQLCPPKKDGSRAVGRHYKFLPELDNFQTYYRHRVLGPYLIFRAHQAAPQLAMCMLCQHPQIHPDTAEQLASRQDMIQSTAIVGCATRLYFNPTTATIRRGATDRQDDNQPKPGTVRRLVDVCWQFDRTYDHGACTPDALLSLLPVEFTPFASGARR